MAEEGGLRIIGTRENLHLASNGEDSIFATTYTQMKKKYNRLERKKHFYLANIIICIYLSETRWGKNNGNKIISTFYDQRGNPHYFTSHVVLEWVLDTTPERRLLTGIAMKPVLKNVNIDEEQTGLYYFLYTYEHDNNGYFTIENLPLYEESTGNVADIENLKIL